MKRPYETMIVFDGTLPDDVLQKEQQQVEDLIKQTANFEKADVWGKVSLLIHQKKKTGYYCLSCMKGKGILSLPSTSILNLPSVSFAT